MNVAVNKYLNDLVESIQRKALRIIYPWRGYEDALKLAGLDTLTNRRDNLAVKFYAKAAVSVPSGSVVEHGNNLRSGTSRAGSLVAKTERLNSFFTYKYQI